MKRLIFSILLLTAMIGHAADDIIVDGVVYRLGNGEYIVAGWDEETPIQSLHILGEVNGLDVSSIADYAFQDNLTIEYVKIDEGVTRIGQNAFFRCKNIKTVIMPERLEQIKQEAFAFCESITTMSIPSTVRTIEDKAFLYCNGVTDAYFLMTTQEALDDFEWVDGVYSTPDQEPFGGLEFNTNQHTIIHVPKDTRDLYVASGRFEAWIDRIQEDDAVYPLWWIVNYGVVGREYTVEDPLTAVYVDIHGDLYAKDDNHWLLPDKMYSGEVDYMANTGLMSGRPYDQSNWVILRGTGLPSGCYSIAGGLVTGRLLDKRNPVIEVTSQLSRGEDATYSPNVYIAASLMGRTQVRNSKTYAFVRPKPQEYARYEWSIYGEDGNFYVPARNEDFGFNQVDLAGGYTPNYDLLTEGDKDDLAVNACYSFFSITRHETAVDELRMWSRDDDAEMSDFRPNVEGGVSMQYTVFPVALPTAPIVTSVSKVVATPVRACYYDLCGRYLGTTPPTSPGIYVKSPLSPHPPKGGESGLACASIEVSGLRACCRKLSGLSP